MVPLKKLITKKNSLGLIAAVALLVSIIALFRYAIPTYLNAKAIGIGIGDKAGKMVGSVIGSFDGITTGLAKGAEDGKDEGLSAKDIESEIKNSFAKTGNLEVLEAGVKLKDVNTLGNYYAALYLLKGVAVYTVDLQDVDINDADTNSIEILLPEICVDVYIDEHATEKLAEYQKHSWAGSAKDGFVEYMNTRDATDESVRKTMENYDELIEQAKSSARRQVDIIAKAATGNKKNIVVMFKTEVQADEN